MNKAKKIEQELRCLNCQYPLDTESNFCPNCGQKALSEKLTIKYFIHEFLNNYFSFDSKFFNTIKPLVIKPAFLSQEFVDGRRIRYINPIQLFVFISFLYFLIDSISFLKESAEGADYIAFKGNGNQVRMDSLENEPFPEKGIATPNDSSSVKINQPFFQEFINKAQEFNALDKDEQNERIAKLISYFIFILMPLFALLIGWFFSKRNRHYLENLIFSLHFHSLFFLVGTFFMLIDRLIPDPFDSLVMDVFIIGYLLIALRRFYRYKWFSTLFRLIGLTVIYGLIVFICFISSVIISIYI